MPQAPSVDRRAYPRHPLASGVQVHHGPSGRQFAARCQDVSGGGMLLYVPAVMPVKTGDSVRVAVDQVDRPDFADLGDGPIAASVARVDRTRLLDVGQVAMGVRFLKA